MRILAAFLITFGLAFAAGKDDTDLRGAMTAYSQAMLKGDQAALGKLFGDGLMYSHSNGMLETKAEAIAAAPKEKYEAFDFSDMKMESYGKTAVVRCNVLVKNGKYPTGLKLNVLHVWAKNGAGWQLVARQSTRLP